MSYLKNMKMVITSFCRGKAVYLNYIPCISCLFKKKKCLRLYKFVQQYNHVKSYMRQSYFLIHWLVKSVISKSNIAPVSYMRMWRVGRNCDFSICQSQELEPESGSTDPDGPFGGMDEFCTSPPVPCLVEEYCDRDLCECRPLGGHRRRCVLYPTISRLSSWLPMGR